MDIVLCPWCSHPAEHHRVNRHSTPETVLRYCVGSKLEPPVWDCCCHKDPNAVREEIVA